MDCKNRFFRIYRVQVYVCVKKIENVDGWYLAPKEKRRSHHSIRPQEDLLSGKVSKTLFTGNDVKKEKKFYSVLVVNTQLLVLTDWRSNRRV